MTSLPPPWCLHWGQDGELASSDHQAVVLCLQRQDDQWARLMLAQTLSRAASGSSPQTLSQHPLLPR